MAKTADSAVGERGIGLFSLAVIGVAGFLAGQLLSSTIAGERIANACFGNAAALSAGGGATDSSCFGVLTEFFDSRSLSDGITGLAQTPLLGSLEKLGLTSEVLQAHGGNPHERQVHNDNLIITVR